jgi:DNA invertase Pin-like site-specific DNA recombinase
VNKNAVVSYVRVSTEKQGASGLGIEAQQAYVTAYCERTGSTLLREFREIESGRNNDRQELAKAITFAKRSKATLVIAKLDRLARNVAFVANLMETRVRFESCDLPGANSMTVHVMAAVAENEAKAISTRTKDALVAAKARGVKLGAHHPSAKPLQPEARAKGQARSARVNREKAIAEYSDVLPIAQDMRVAGDSLGAIAKHLNAEGYVTRTGSAWSAVQVMRVLKRAA